MEQKRRGEKAELPDSLRQKWAERVPLAFTQLEKAETTSPLPDEAPNAEDLERWLIQQRMGEIAASR